ncbi:hypothetical protein [Sporichthya sp.]|uniref:hypothetical protein n=1 Tax=Sporichthya sp. TaxID=65475 RepID=UPI00184B94E9|nr:hypothetical protein [Sporichthya sp.]MBA3742064.1 hypothetical protein [Sporichthya sp.]
MSARIQLWCLWCGLAAMALFVAGLLLVAGLVPPPSPSDSALEIQRFYADDTNAIRAGLAMATIGASLTAPFVVVITCQLLRIEGRSAPLAYLQLGTGMLGVLIIAFPMMLIEAAAFRPERDAELIRAINDIAWITLIGTLGQIMLQCGAIAVAAFRDETSQVLPRWVGYFNLLVALAFPPGLILFFVKTGPFAWNGLLAFWYPLSLFAVWFGVMFVVLRRAIATEATMPRASDPMDALAPA